MKWIHVEDEKPNDGELVIAYFESGFIVPERVEVVVAGGSVWNHYKPTAWMRLPEPPRKDDPDNAEQLSFA